MVNSGTEWSIEQARSHFEMLQARLNAAKIAYLNGTELDGEAMSYERLKGIAQQMIEANYSLQKARYGKVRLKLTVAKLLRRGR
jgi:hypothetical protein